MSHYADWRQSLGPGRLRREAAGWSLAALTVAATATAAATAAFRVEELGHRDALQEALYLDLEPVPPAPAALAAPEAAPEVPQVEAPVAPEPEEIAEQEPELAPPPPDVRPSAETVDLPDIPVPTSETFAYDPPPP
ncbi:energy transducer TonB, partial [Rhodobacter sphaeroides]|nr:energy transducer TonB [Cereibacter sphaeroides]